MSKKTKRVFVQLCIILLSAFMPAFALAIGTIDTERTVEVTLCCRDKDKAISGASFEIYMVAETDEYTHMTLTGNFDKFKNSVTGLSDLDNVSEEEWFAIANTLESKLIGAGIAPEAEGTTDENGLYSLPYPLKPGLYLVISKNDVEGKGEIYSPANFMMFLPGKNSADDVWNFNVIADAKTEIYPAAESNKADRISRKVLKIWDDEGHEDSRPKELKVRLFRNGKLYDTAILNEKNDWSFRWDDLDPDRRWNVDEEDVEGYSSSVGQEGKTFIIRNTYSEAKPDSESTVRSGIDQPADVPSVVSDQKDESDSSAPTKKIPQTGLLWWPVPVLAFAGIGLIIAGVKIRCSN